MTVAPPITSTGLGPHGTCVQDKLEETELKTRSTVPFVRLRILVSPI